MIIKKGWFKTIKSFFSTVFIIIVFFYCAAAINADTASSLTYTASAVETPVPNDKGNFIEISGSKSSAFHYSYYGGGYAGALNGFTRNDAFSLNLSGNILEEIKVNGSFSQSDSELENKYGLNFTGKSWKLMLGDINTGTESSTMGLYSRSLTGAQFDGTFGNFEISAIAAVPKGRAEYQRVLGNGTQGTFQLNFAPVVTGSVRVFINGKEQKADQEYTVDYMIGRILLKNRILDYTDSMDITYEAKENLYERSLYGGGASYALEKLPLINKGKIGIKYFTENDNNNSAQIIYQASGVSPAAHAVYGVTGEIENEIIKLKSEYMHSETNQNILTGIKTAGDAASADASINLSDLVLSGFYKMTNPQFVSMGNSTLGTDVLNYGAKGDYKLAGVLSVAGEYEYSRNLINAIKNEIKDINLKASYKQSGLPYADYAYCLSQERNNDVYPNNIDQKLDRHTGSIGYNFTFLNVSAEYNREKREGNFGDRPSTLSQGVGAKASLQNMGAFTLQLGADYRNVDRVATTTTAAADYYTLALTGNSNFSLENFLKLDAANSLVIDAYDGNRYNLNTSIGFTPLKELKADGKYSLQTLSREIAGLQKPVYSESWSASLEGTPHVTIKLSYRLSNNGSKLMATGRETDSIRNETYSASYAPFDFVSTTGDYTVDRYVLNSSLYDYLPLQLKRDTNTMDFSVKLSPAEVLSTETSYMNKDLGEENRDIAAGLTTTVKGNEKNFAASIRSSLAEDFSASISYVYAEQIRGGSGVYQSITGTPYPVSDLNKTINDLNKISVDSNVNFSSHTITGKLSKRWIKEINTYASMDYDNRIDRLFKLNVATYAPGAGFELIIARFKLNLSYKAGFSTGNSSIFQEAYTGDINFTPFQNINMAVKGTYARSKNPDTNATDVTANFGMNF
jgi:hypothetical protein